MNTWLLIALIAPFLWALVNHADKYLLSKYFKVDGVGPLMIFSTLFGVFVLPVAFIIDPSILSLSLHDCLILIFAGLCSALFVLLYLQALQEEETSVVVPFWQTIPIFAYILGYIFFKETLTTQQIYAGLIILIGATILSFDITEKIKFKAKVVLLMLGSSFVYALYEALFKFVAIEESFWASVFWEHVGLIIFGLFIVTFFKKHRRAFLNTLKGNSAPIISLNLGSETLTIIGNLITNYVVLLAPLALVLLVSSYQPLFVFLIGITLSLLLPHIAQENLGKKIIVQKISAIIIIFIGSYLLN